MHKRRFKRVVFYIRFFLNKFKKDKTLPALLTPYYIYERIEDNWDNKNNIFNHTFCETEGMLL